MKTFLIGLLLIGGASGCLNVQPVGPLSKITGTPKSKPLTKDDLEQVSASAPRPVPPAMLVTPGDVSAENADEIVRKSKLELQTDGKSTANVSLVSEYKGGVKVR
jgi:hypothetical protein